MLLPPLAECSPLRLSRLPTRSTPETQALTRRLRSTTAAALACQHGPALSLRSTTYTRKLTHSNKQKRDGCSNRPAWGRRAASKLLRSHNPFAPSFATIIGEPEICNVRPLWMCVLVAFTSHVERLCVPIRRSSFDLTIATVLAQNHPCTVRPFSFVTATLHGCARLLH